MKTALISGASRGIGKALAEIFLKNGYVVFGTSTTGKANWQHENLTFFELDLGNERSIAACFQKIEQSGRRIDVLVNNAGIAVEAEFESPVMVPEYVRKTLEINVVGTIDFTERIIPLLNEGAHIVNVSSRAGSLSHTEYSLNYPGYRISKAALNMVTRILAVRLDGHVRVSSVHPGWVKTDMGGEEAPTEPQEAAQQIFALAVGDKPSGKFWYINEEFEW